MSAQALLSSLQKIVNLEPSKPVYVLSPHLDDAAFSLGGLLQLLGTHGYEIHIVTIFSISPIVHGKLVSPAEATHVRKTEDAAVCAAMGAQATYLDFPEALLREHSINKIFDAAYKPPDYLFDTIVQEVKKTLPSSCTLFAPSAFGGHVDHVTTRLAAEVLKRPVVFFEDLPYATWSEQRSSAETFLTKKQLQEQRLSVQGDLIAEHLRLYHLYASQSNEAEAKQIESYLTKRGFGLWV